MNKEFDVEPGEFSAWNAIARWIMRCNEYVLLLGPIYLLWRGEWKLAGKVYGPTTVLAVLGFALMGYGFAGNSSVPVWAGTLIAILCLVAVLACNFWLHFRWNAVPHPQERRLLPALAGAVAIIFLLPFSMQIGALLA